MRCAISIGLLLHHCPKQPKHLKEMTMVRDIFSDRVKLLALEEENKRLREVLEEIIRIRNDRTNTQVLYEIASVAKQALKGE